jgi:integrase
MAKRSNGEGTAIKQIINADGSKGLWCQRLTINGKRRAYYGQTQGEVRDKVKVAQKDIANGTYAAPSSITVGDWLTKWLNDYKKLTLRQTTWDSYELMARQHIIPAVGDIKLSKLTTGNLQRLYNDKLKAGRADDKEGGLSVRTVRYIHQVLHGMLDQALKEGMIGRNVSEAVELPKEERRKIQVMDTAGVGKFLSIARSSRFYMAFLLTLGTGMRRGEVLGLKWENIDFKTNTIRIEQQVISTKDGVKLVPWTKTKTSKRIIDVPEQIMRQLQAIPVRQIGGLVFTNEIGGMMNPNNFVRDYKNLLKKAGLNTYSFHSLRHTFATLQIENGTSINAVQETLGHAKASTTSDIYTDVTSKMKKQAASTIGNILDNCINE